MSMSVGAPSSALSYLQSLLQSGSGGAGATSSTDPLSMLEQSLGGGSGGDPLTQAGSTPGSNALTVPAPPLDNGTLSALFSLQSQGGSGASGPLGKMDADGDGKVSKSEFENGLSGAGVSKSSADALFSKLDANGDGSVTQSDMSGMQHAHGHHHGGGGGAKGAGGGGGGDASSLMDATDATGATTQTVTNADGSTTTTVTNADGTTSVTTTAAAPSLGGDTSGNGTPGGKAGSQQAETNNLIQQLTQMQSLLTTVAGTALSALI